MFMFEQEFIENNFCMFSGRIIVNYLLWFIIALVEDILAGLTLGGQRDVEMLEQPEVEVVIMAD